jgi:ubiquitin thioesterase OTU1
MPALTLRVRGPSGQATITCPDGCTVAQLRQLIADATQVPPARQDMLIGYPPRRLPSSADGGGDDDAAGAEATFGLANGDSLTVRVREAEASPPPAAPAAPAAAAPAATAAADGTTAAAAAAAAFVDASNGDGVDEDEALARAIAASMEEPQPPPRPAAAAAAAVPTAAAAAAAAPVTVSDAPKDGRCPTSAPIPGLFPTRHVARRVVASDNSCLFNAVAYAMEGSSPASRTGPSGRRDPSHAPALRAVVARRVRSDPGTFTEAYLGGQTAEAYARWIEQPKHWGGAVELAILSDFYRREIAAYCIQTKRCDVYGEGKGYRERAMVVYDGLHYDALAVAPDGSEAQGSEARDATIFEAGGAEAEAAGLGAAAFVDACHRARQFTDTANFTLRCGVCGVGLKGEKEAVVHAGQTGHQNFAEY